MTKKYIFLSFMFSLVFLSGYSQVKISGVVKDENNQSIPFASIVFVGSSTGTVSDENGKFYLESVKTYTKIEVSFLGYENKIVPIKSRNFNLIIVLKEAAAQLEQVFIYSGKVKKKGNPAIAILEKIWAKKRENGIYLFDQYQYNKYEKLEFDMNNIDSALIKSKLFKGMEFVFEGIDTSNVTGKAFLPIFINESVYKSFGKNKGGKKLKEDLVANKNSGFSNNQNVIAFIKDLYVDYNVYDSYIKIFDKSFVSPISKAAGVSTYNYILADSAFIDNKWCFNILYYPRRKGELTFKGNFWVNDTTFAIKKINMQANKSANINWVKDIYIEQDFEVLNDSVFLLQRDYMMSDFSLNKKDKSKGLYGKRTTMFKDYKFNIKKEDAFYNEEINAYDKNIYAKTDDYWSENRQEKLNENELGIYKLLDTLSTVPKFKRIYNLVSILGSGYIEFNKFDFGDVFSTFGKNDVEGWRLRAGGRTYLGGNEPWRLQGYTAYGFKDDKFKYGFSGKWMLNPKSRFTVGLGNRRDVEQIGVSLTTTNDVMGRSFASSSLFSSGDNSKLTSINLSNFFMSIEPRHNLNFKIGASYRTLESASPQTFNLDYWVDKENNIKKSEVAQSEVDFTVTYTPSRKTIGFGVERNEVTDTYSTLFLNYSKGIKGLFNSDFDYHKVQFYYRQPILIGGLGRMFTTFEAGKTFGEVPLGLLNVVPGNQSYFTIENTYSLLDYYEFVTDTYASLHVEHNFNGKFFSRIPLFRKLNLREIVGAKAVWGQISDKNIALSASNINYLAPSKVYYEYSVGVGNIFKVFRIDFSWRGNYRDVPNANNFAIKGAFGFHF
ncbi:MAG: carboxypeptidase-like regulatory domain-containing protein [Gelidibacter sp.]|nr:carboxypeptidase-like regulatory domain-containing protein [Gelidibacter sp.]